MIYNYLAAAYSRIGDQKATRLISEEIYHLDPDYLFAKINMAQIYLREGDVEKIPEIFDHKFDLKMLYPRRNKFHVTEFAGFTGLMCAYFAMIGNQETAKLLYDTLLKVAPDSEMIPFAQRFLNPSLATKLKMWAIEKSRKMDTAKVKEEKTPPEDSDFIA